MAGVLQGDGEELPSPPQVTVQPPPQVMADAGVACEAGRDEPEGSHEAPSIPPSQDKSFLDPSPKAKPSPTLAKLLDDGTGSKD